MSQSSNDDLPVLDELFNEADLDDYFKQSLLQSSFSSNEDEGYYEDYALYKDEEIVKSTTNLNEEHADKAYQELVAHFQLQNHVDPLAYDSSDEGERVIEQHSDLNQAKSNPNLSVKISEHMSLEDKEQLRFALACHCYPSHEIYETGVYQTPVAMMHRVLGQGDILSCAQQCSFISRVDIAYVEYLHRHYPLANSEDQQVFDLVLLTLFAHMQEGDICINLHSLQDIYDTLEQWDILRTEMFMRNQDCMAVNNLLSVAQSYVPDSVSSLEQILSRAICVGTQQEHNSPLVYDLQRLYLRRYFNYEVEVTHYINNVVKVDFDETKKELLGKLIALLFPLDEDLQDVNWQKVAALMSSTSKFSVISGGPGTGKTTTVLRIILMLICLDSNNRNIKMCAPTGKAAARMGESIALQLKDERTYQTIAQLSALSGLSAEEIRSYIPTEAVTVQKLIKTVPNHATPIFNKDHRLMCDVLVVDEVSMLDLALFAKLIAALPDNCQLILLGDKDQLASVEAGSVLADLCSCLNSQDLERLDPHMLDFIAHLSGYSKEQILSGKIANNVTLLQFSYRSKDVPQIGALASLVNAPLPSQEQESKLLDIVSYLDLKRTQRDPELFDEQELDNEAIAKRTDEVLAQFAQDHSQAIKINLYSKGQEYSSSEQFCINFAQSCIKRKQNNNYSKFLEYLEKHHFNVSTDPKELSEIFRLMDGYRVLCSNHSGEFGDQNINKLIELEVKRTYLKKERSNLKGEFFPGKIVIITKNDSELQLVNGYVGFCALVNDELRVIIPKGIREDNGKSLMEFNIISPMLLTHYDSGFAMSIHKSQGSEYDHVSILLSKEANRVLNKELVYTGITRAKKSLTLLGTKASLSYALGHSVQRRSGLAQRIKF